MKKKTILITIGLTIITEEIILIFINKPTSVENFNLSDYQWEIEQFSSDKNIGKIDNLNITIKKSKEAWIEKFNSINGESFNPINGEPIKVYFDENNDCWYLHGTLPKNWDGGAPHILIQKSDGKVLAVWHDK